MYLNLQRDCGRPPIPGKDPGDKPEEEPLLSNHPYVDKVYPVSIHLFKLVARYKHGGLFILCMGAPQFTLNTFLLKNVLVNIHLL